MSGVESWRLNFFRKTPRHLSIYFQKEVNSRGFIWREGVPIVEDSEELGTVFLQVGGPSWGGWGGGEGQLKAHHVLTI